MGDFVGAVDQGTTSTRFLVFDHGGNEVARHQLEHDQILPRAGWVEHDPVQIWEHTRTAMGAALRGAKLSTSDLVAVGVTNQRETTVVWDRRTGRPYHNAIVWQDTRTDPMAAALEADGSGELIRLRSGLRPAGYFSAGKVRWLLDNVPGVRAAAAAGEALAGTIDSWLLWNLTGGIDGGLHSTDVTNASRTMLMGLHTLDWDEELLELFDIPRSMLPSIEPSAGAGTFGHTAQETAGPVPITAVLGDQHAAMVGQLCLSPGEVKSTYGTGSFLLLNTGHRPVQSDNGLLTTVAYQWADQPPVYALEGSVAVTGSAVQWLRDQLRLIPDAAHSETLACQVQDNAGCYFVPAFAGLFAPHWRPDARGTIVGLSRFHTAAHIMRAVLEAICYQTRDVVGAMEQCSGMSLEVLKVDGGVTANALCMQIQADVLGVPVSRPVVAETTSLGAAYAAGLAVGFWKSPDELRRQWKESRRWQPQWDADRREQSYRDWQRALSRSLDWAEV